MIFAETARLLPGVLGGEGVDDRGEHVDRGHAGVERRVVAARFELADRSYSIQTLKRLKPALLRQDLIALLDLLQRKKIKPLMAQRFPLTEARQAQESLGKGDVAGGIVLVHDGSSLEPGSAKPAANRTRYSRLRLVSRTG